MTDPNVKEDEGPQETGTTLLNRLRNRDEEGWKRFVHLYSPLIFEWCRRAGLQNEDTADVGQDVFCAVSASIDTFRRDRPGDSFRGWLRTITVHKICDRRRRQSRPGGQGIGGDGTTLSREESVANESFSVSDEDTHGPADELTLMRRAVDMVLAEYDEVTKTAFLRVVVGEESPADVGRSLGLTVNSVYLAKSRIKQRIRAEFAGLIETL